MSRTSRNSMKNSSFFHIMVQGINKEYIFNNAKDKEKYLKLIYENNENIRIMAYCIMDNHAHILIFADDIAKMELWMKKVNISYARYYNKKNDRVGYVFRNRYKSQIIKTKKHLYLAIKYIHINPVKALICKKEEDYEFSSYAKIYNSDLSEIYNKIEEFLNQTAITMDVNDEKSEKFELIEDEEKNKEEICKDIINNFLSQNEISKEKLKKAKKLLIELLEELHNKNNISYKLMEKYLEISREKLRKLIIEKGE